MNDGNLQIEHREYFFILLLNRANKVLGVSTVSMGGMSGTVADPKIIFQTALKVSAASVILCHNHPSGNIKPSESDIRLTQKIKKAGSFLDLPCLDHIILTEDSYFSFADEGMLWSFQPWSLQDHGFVIAPVILADAFVLLVDTMILFATIIPLLNWETRNNPTLHFMRKGIQADWELPLRLFKWFPPGCIVIIVSLKI